MISYTFNLYRTESNQPWGTGTFEFEQAVGELTGNVTVEGPISTKGSIKGLRIPCGDLKVYQFVDAKGGEGTLGMTLIENPYEGRVSYSGSMTLSGGQAVLNLAAVA